MNFQNTILIMTSNIGSSYLLEGIDSEGNIVGDVIVGGLDNEKTMASVQKQIDEILAK